MPQRFANDPSPFETAAAVLLGWGVAADVCVAAAGACLTLSLAGSLFGNDGSSSVGEKSKYHANAVKAKIAQTMFFILPEKGSTKCAKKAAPVRQIRTA